jgi:hypothetical protein
MSGKFYKIRSSNFSQVLDKRYAEPISPAYIEKPFNSPIRITVRRDFRDTI